MDRRPELSVVWSDKQGQTEASGDLVGGHLSDQGASGVLRGERLRYGYCRVTGVAHVQVVVPVVGDRGNGAREHLRERSRFTQVTEAGGLALPSSSRSDYRCPLKRRALPNAVRDVGLCEIRRPTADALADRAHRRFISNG